MLSNEHVKVTQSQKDKIYETAEISRTSVMEFLFRKTLNTY